METTLSQLLLLLMSFALLFHLVTSLNYLRNRKHISCIPHLSSKDTNNPINNCDTDLSVCIPCRNEEKNLRKTLDSLLVQTKKNISILILNDQSPGKDENCYWTDFLNQQTAFYFGAEVMANQMDAAVVNGVIRRVKRGQYEIEFYLITNCPKNESYGYITET